MAVRLVCWACGKRLKLPDGLTAKRSAKCPKCLAPVDLTPALEASAYLPTVAVPGTVAPADLDANRKAPALLGEDDPLPYPTKPAVTVTRPAPVPKPTPQPIAPPKPPALLGEDDPLPYLPNPLLPPRSTENSAARAVQSPVSANGPPKHQTLNTKHQTPNTNEEVLSLDDDPSDAPHVEPVPFRVPVRVLADSLAADIGPCVAVLLPHGLFLEHEPMKPFLYVPPGARVDSPAPDELTVALPDGRSVTLRFQARYARPLARDTRAFLAGERPVPVAADYRIKWWMMWAALIFALGPIVLSQTVELGLKFGPQVGAGLALAGFLANTAIVIFSRCAVPVQIVVMVGGGALVTGAFLFVATAYLAGRQEGAEQAKPEPPPPQPPPPLPPPKPPEPLPERPPSHIDRAKKHGSSALEDGPAEVTALALAPDGKTLGIGYADGTTRLWPLDQPTFDAMLPGPKADGPVTRVQFDTKTRFIFAHTATGVVAAPTTGPPAAPAKLPGAPVAIASDLDGDRVRFAAVRGNAIQHRVIAAAFVQTPPKVKGYAQPARSDEIVPAGSGKDPNKPTGLTFLAWTPGGRLLAGQPDGTINIWSTATRAEAPSRDHRAAVKAWAECAATGAFATGDDAGNLGLWSAKGGKPVIAEKVLATAVTGLSFNPSGTRLAVTDTTGWLVLWDPAAEKAVQRVKRPTAVKAMTFGPGEDVILLAAGRTVEVWWIPKLLVE